MVSSAPPFPYPPTTPLPPQGRWADPTRPPEWNPTPVPASTKPRPQWQRILVAAVCGVLLTVAAAAAGFMGGVYAQLDEPGGIVVTQRPGTSNIARIAEAAAPSVVTIETGYGTGTGFVVARSDGERFVVTNAHVVAGTTEEVEVLASTGDRLTGKVLGRNPEVDLAVVRVPGLEVVPLELDTELPQVGEAVVVIGNALGLGASHSVTSGIVSAVERNLTAPNGTVLDGLVQTDAAINPGNSGGPMLDMSGRVIGVTTAKIDPAVASNVGFAVPAFVVANLIDTLSEGTRLGVNVETVDGGALVVGVASGSAADDAGIVEGDIITRFDGEEITTADELVAAVSRRSPGDVVDVELRRGGEVLQLRVTLKAA